MKKFLFYLTVVISFFVMLSKIVPITAEWWDDYKRKKEEFDGPKEEELDPDKPIDLTEQVDGSFATGNGRQF